MTTAPWDDDERLLGELRAAVQQAGTPTPGMTAAAEAAFSWRTVDAELAVLSEEAASSESALVRGTSTAPRILEFRTAQQSVELEQTASGLVGQLVPPTPGLVTLLGRGGELVRVDADELGCFTLDHPSGDLVRVRCDTASGALVTEWFRL
jgi:hypothetical protein